LKTVQTPIGAPKIATRPVLIPPRPPHRIAGRDSVIAEMKKRLLAGGSHALLGPRHTGKRAIALELVYDEELRQAYPDGVLWSDLREEGSAGAELASWADALGITRNTISALKRPQDRAVAVA